MKNKNQILLFLGICLPLSWIFTVLAYKIGPESGIGGFFAMIVAFAPAVAAIICKKCAGESIRSLKILPNIDGNAGVYLAAILIGAGMSIWSTPLVAACFFPDVSFLNPEVEFMMIVSQILLYTAIGCVQFFVLMGEEIGWMGFLYPQLEKMCGEIFAVIITGIVRVIWHGGMIIYTEEPLNVALSLLLSNVIMGVLLVILTKKSDSVIPASICHAVSNALPGVVATFFVFDNNAYMIHRFAIEVIAIAPFVVLAIVCFLILPEKFVRKSV